MTTVTTNTVPTIDELINNVADTVKREYGATKDLAVRLCSEIKAFDGVQWFDVEHSDTREGAKPTLEVAQKFRDALRKAGHKNPSVMWTRVRNEGRNHVKALAVQAGEVGEDEGEGSGANAKRGLGKEETVFTVICRIHGVAFFLKAALDKVGDLFLVFYD